MSASDRVIEAARRVVLEKCATLKGDKGIEMDDGEKGYIVHSELLWQLECAVADYDKRRAEMKRTASEATGG